MVAKTPRQAVNTERLVTKDTMWLVIPSTFHYEWRHKKRRRILGKACKYACKFHLDYCGVTIPAVHWAELSGDKSRAMPLCRSCHYWYDHPNGQPERVAATIRAHKGKSLSEETRRKISITLTGQRHTPEARRKISESMRGKPSRTKGMKYSPEARARMAASQRRRREREMMDKRGQ
jgi:hypothetical protein